MKMKKSFKRPLAFVLAFALLATTIGIGAYLTDSDVKKDVYTVGNVQAEIVSNGDMELDNVGALLPGTVHVYERAATNTGINDAYVFMSLTIPYEMVGVSDTDGTQIGERVRQLFIPGVNGGYIGSEWKLVDVGYIGQYEIEDNGQYCGEHDQYSAVVGDTITYVYGFIGDNADGSLKALASGETTSNLVETMQLTNLYNASKITGEVSTKLYAIQSGNVNGGLTDVNGVWAVINKAISGEANQTATLTYSIKNTRTSEAVGYAPLKLVNENGDTVATSVANESGNGQFQNVPAGAYTVETEVGDLSVTSGSTGYGLRRYANAVANVVIAEDSSIEFGLTTPVNTLVQGPIFNTYIPDNVTSIEFVAMPQTYGLADATVPADAIDVSEAADGSVMAWVEDDTFYVVAMDGGMIYANPNCNSMFQDKSNLTYIGTDNLSTLGVYRGQFIFSGCGSLTNDINDFNLENMRDLYGAFYNCAWLTEYTIPEGTTTIHSQAFSHCRSLTTIIIPEGVKDISGWAFQGCYNLTNVSLPSSITTIGYCAFQNCTNITSVHIPASVTEIGDMAFSRCDKLTAINVDPANENYVSVDGVLYTKDMKTLIAYPAGKTATSYVIPDGVEEIGVYAFYNCGTLATIEIPTSVTSIGDRAFFGTPWLNNQVNAGEIVIVNGVWVDASNATGDFIIPDGATSIPASLFANNHNITSVVIPTSVVSIGENAFSNCTALTTVTFEEGSNLKTIGDSAFSGCVNLNNIVLPDSVENIGYSAFSNCSSLTSINIPANTTRLQAVFFNSGLTSVTLPNNLTYVYNEFNNCSNLTEFIVAGDHPTLAVVDGVLYSKGMDTLIKYPMGKTDKSYTVPAGVHSISMSAFAYNSYIEEIVLPDSITFIDMTCLENCSNLKTINFCGTQAQWNQVYFEYNWNSGVHADFKVVYDYVSADVIPDDNTGEITGPELSEGQIAVYIVDNTSNTANVEKPSTYYIFVGGKAHQAQLAYGDEYVILSGLADGTYTVSITVEYPTLGVQSPNQNIEEVIIDADNRVITVVLSD